MSKRKLLPRLALSGILKNGDTSLPYLAACIFAVFSYFVFSSILNNDLMTILPHAGHAWILMRIGLVLLGLILVPFLFYTNSFLIRRRSKELGLYSILGMEKKQIGMMLALETVFIYLLVLVISLLSGLVFSKLLFLLLLNLTGLPVDVAFTFHWGSVYESAVFWGVISVLNLSVNLFQVGRTNPTQMMRKSRKGEKEAKGTVVLGAAGVAALSAGYYLSITAQIDSFIYLKFFGAVFLVVTGTYFTFCWFSVVILRILKNNRRVFYQKENFIIISGMYSRMRKNAASLVNMCVFATMVIITLLCTASLYVGTADILQLDYPYDLQMHFKRGDAAMQYREDLMALAGEMQVTPETLFSYPYLTVSLEEKDDQFTIYTDKRFSMEGRYPVTFILLEDFNTCEGTTYELASDEVMVYSTGGDFGHEEIRFEERSYRVKEELSQSLIDNKEVKDVFQKEYYMILPDEAALRMCRDLWGDDIQEGNCLFIKLAGAEEAVEAYIGQAVDLVSGYEQGEITFQDGAAGRKQTRVMNGGLLFLGIFFGIIFTMCLILVMYYKQITEGFEDRNNFEIMRQVGMSDQEVRSAIKRQVFMVFFIPLAGAALHTAAGLPMTIHLLSSIRLFDIRIILICSAAMFVVLCLIYAGIYQMTAKAYLRIVYKRAQ